MLAHAKRLVAFGWLLGLAALTPTLNFAPQQLTTMADQYHLWALPGWLLVLALLGRQAVERLSPLPNGARGNNGKFLPATLSSGFALFLGLLAWARAPEYGSPLAVATANVAREPDSALAWARYARALKASDEAELRVRAGWAGLRALDAPDAHRIQLQERALALTEAAVELCRRADWARADELLDRECPRFARLALPYADLIRAEVATRTGRPGQALLLLTGHYGPKYSAAAEQLGVVCRDGAKLPDSTPPFPTVPEQLPPHEKIIWAEFSKRFLLVLAQATLDVHGAERAFGISALLVNAHPDYDLGRRLLAQIYDRLGLPDAAAAVLAPASRK
jgi:hypothetical protein